MVLQLKDFNFAKKVFTYFSIGEHLARYLLTSYNFTYSAKKVTKFLLQILKTNYSCSYIITVRVTVTLSDQKFWPKTTVDCQAAESESLSIKRG